MKHYARTLISILILGLSCSFVQAATLSYTDSVPLTRTNWTRYVTVPKFDPSLGTLTGITFTVKSHVEGTAKYENLGPNPALVTSTLAASITILHPDNSVLVGVDPEFVYQQTAAAFDGVVDFSGDSGATHEGIVADGEAGSSSPPPTSDLALFTGPGDITLTAVAAARSRVTGPGNLAAIFQTFASAEVIVTYEYAPHGSIGDLVWLDSDADGLYEPEIGEIGINDVEVALYLDDVLVATTLTANHPTTGEPGWYLFDNLSPGNYRVEVTSDNFVSGNPLYGYAQTYDYDGTLDNYTTYILSPGEDFPEADFGYRPWDNPGTGTPGYWKNHPSAWPVEEIVIGGHTYTKSQAIAIMNESEKGDKTRTMFRALVCAKLNVGIGNDSSPIEETIHTADAWMHIYGPVGNGVKASSSAWKIGEPLYILLDQYNNGRLGVPHR